VSLTLFFPVLISRVCFGFREYRESEAYVELRVNEEESLTFGYPELEWDVELEMAFSFERELESEFLAEPLQAVG
jgi:hypothetical protein